MDITLLNLISPHLKIIIGCFIIFLLSASMTWIVRHYAIQKAILDIPNERSSHQIPTPRGGGIAIVFTFILSLFILSLIGYIETHLAIALIGGGLAVALIGYADDIYSIRARWRILVHFLAGIWALCWVGNLTTLNLGTWTFSLNSGGFLLALIGIVWCINLYNFMDGIDGLAGSEGIFVALCGGFALLFVGEEQLACALWLLAAAIFGFTVWNWPPAKIFLGDAGSGFLGYVFAIFALYSLNNSLLTLSFWWIIAGVFFCDATFTLVSRVLEGKCWYHAHREHAFQRLICRGANHKQVTISILIYNCCTLLPAAFATLFWPAQALWIMLGATIYLWLTWSYIQNNVELTFSNETAAET